MQTVQFSEITEKIKAGEITCIKDLQPYAKVKLQGDSPVIRLGNGTKPWIIYDMSYWANEVRLFRSDMSRSRDMSFTWDKDYQTPISLFNES